MIGCLDIDLISARKREMGHRDSANVSCPSCLYELVRIRDLDIKSGIDPKAIDGIPPCHF